jgi:hypothetical protein
LGYESFERRPKVVHLPSYRPLYLGLRISPTGDCPALSLPASDGIVSEQGVSRVGVSGPVWSRTPSALRSSATRDRIGRPGTARPMQASSGTAGYLSVWSSISALGALRLTDSMPLMALALLS